MAQYILNMGGHNVSSPLDTVDTVDIFRISSHRVEAVTGHNLTLSVGRRNLAAASCGNYILAMGGRITGNYQSNAIDIFRATANGVEAVTGHNLTLSSARWALAAASCGNYILAMGGWDGVGFHNRVDVFKVTENGVEAVTGHGLTLSVPNADLAAASAGNYVLAMGGNGNGHPTNAVDVFKVTENGVEAVTGHGLTLSVARRYLAAASAGNYVLAMGGQGSGGYSDAIDVFRVTDNGVEAVTGHGLTLSSARNYLAAASCGNYILAMGGYTGSIRTSAVDVFKVTDNGVEAVTDHGLTLSVARANLAAASAGNHVLAMGGDYGSTYYNTVDVFQVFN